MSSHCLPSLDLPQIIRTPSSTIIATIPLPPLDTRSRSTPSFSNIIMSERLSVNNIPRNQCKRRGTPLTWVLSLQSADCRLHNGEIWSKFQISIFKCLKPGFFHWDFVFLNLFRISCFVLCIFYLMLCWFWLCQLRYWIIFSYPNRRWSCFCHFSSILIMPYLHVQ